MKWGRVIANALARRVSYERAGYTFRSLIGLLGVLKWEQAQIRCKSSWGRLLSAAIHLRPRTGTVNDGSGNTP